MRGPVQESGHYLGGAPYIPHSASERKGRMPSLYDHAGRDDGLRRLEETFYAKLLADPTLKALFSSAHPRHIEHLTWFTAEAFGGPDRFTQELGFNHMVQAHRDLDITEEQRQRFVPHYLAAFAEIGMSVDGPLPAAFRTHVEFGSQVVKQNSHARADAELHPLRRVPTWSSSWHEIAGQEPPR